MQCPILTNVFKILIGGLLFESHLFWVFTGGQCSTPAGIPTVFDRRRGGVVEVGFVLCWNHMNSEMPILVK